MALLTELFCVYSLIELQALQGVVSAEFRVKLHHKIVPTVLYLYDEDGMMLVHIRPISLCTCLI